MHENEENVEALEGKLDKVGPQLVCFDPPDYILSDVKTGDKAGQHDGGSSAILD